MIMLAIIEIISNGIDFMTRVVFSHISYYISCFQRGQIPQKLCVRLEIFNEQKFEKN